MKKMLTSAVLAFAVLAACNTNPATPSTNVEVSKQPVIDNQKSKVLGVLEVELSSEQGSVSSAKFIEAGSSGLSAKGVAVPITSSNWVFTPGTTTYLTDANFKYLQNTITLENKTGTSFSNLAMYALNTSSNIGGTAFSAVKTLAGVALTGTTASDVARAVMPMHGMTNTTTVDPNKADLMLYTPDEAAAVQAQLVAPNFALSSPTVLEYGFLARNLAGGARAIGTSAAACSSGPTCNKATITWAFKFPLSLPNSSNLGKFTLKYVVVNETVEFITQSREELNPVGVSRVLEAFNGSSSTSKMVNVLPGSGFFGKPGRVLCKVRTAGTSLSPTDFLVNGLAVTSSTPAPNGLSTSSAVGISLCDSAQGLSQDTLVIKASQTGQRVTSAGAFNSGTFAGNSSQSFSYQTASGAGFKPGEEVEVTLTNGVSGPGGSALAPFTYEFRNRPVASSQFGFQGHGLESKSGGRAATSISSGDFNNDGVQDVVVAHQAASNSVASGQNRASISVVLSNPGRTRSAPVRYAFNNTQIPVKLFVADLNKDGNQDVVSQNYDASFSVLFGNGTGQLSNKTDYSIPNVYLGSLALGDFTGDSNLDVAVAIWDSLDGFRVHTFENTGNGTLTLNPNSTQLTNSFQFMVLGTGDFNADGKTDVAISNTDSTNVLIQSSSTSRFTMGYSSTSFGCREGTLLTGDLNGDGRDDLACTGQVKLNNGQPSLFNAGYSQFNAYNQIGNNAGPSNAILGDFNGDGFKDIAYTVFNSNIGALAIYYGNGNGGFSLGDLISDTIGQVNYADVDGDGKKDFTTVIQGYDASNPYAFDNHVIYTLYGNTYGSFDAVRGVARVGLQVGQVVVGDFTSDNKLDMVVSDGYQENKVYLFKGLGNGKFDGGTALSGFPSSLALSLGKGDFNHDGKLDVVFSSLTSNGLLSISFGNGAGGFTSGPSVVTSKSISDLHTADLNGDGNTDIVGQKYASDGALGVQMFFTNASGAIVGSETIPITDYYGYVSWLDISDLNNDGRLDISFVVNGFGNSETLTLHHYLNYGSGNFVEIGMPVDIGTSAFATADFNKDGTVDRVILKQKKLFFYAGNGDGSFSSATTTPTILDYTKQGRLIAADFDGDGNLDLFFEGESNGSVAVFRGLGNGSFAASSPSDFSPGDFIRSDGAGGRYDSRTEIGDVNSDGKPDLIVRNQRAVLVITKLP
jgi:FG-GAP-like repeat